MKSSFCDLCKYFRPDADGITCEAYPDDIPRSIYHDGEKHFKSRGDDSGIVFEPKDDPRYIEAAMSLGYVPAGKIPKIHL